MSKVTKRELEEEVEHLRSKLEQAHDLIADALGYDEDDEDDENDANDENDEVEDKKDS
jgi:hypothetical protein